MSDNIATTTNIPHSDYTYSNGSYSMQPQKLINEFLLKHSRIYISEKMKIYGTICSVLNRAWINVCCVHVSKSQLLCETRKSALEYSNNRFLLMSKIGLNEGPQKLINQFLMSKYPCAYISVRKRILRTIKSSSERAWLAAFYMQVSKSQLYCALRKSPLNI